METSGNPVSLERKEDTVEVPLANDGSNQSSSFADENGLLHQKSSIDILESISQDPDRPPLVITTTNSKVDSEVDSVSLVQIESDDLANLKAVISCDKSETEENEEADKITSTEESPWLNLASSSSSKGSQGSYADQVPSLSNSNTAGSANSQQKEETIPFQGQTPQRMKRDPPETHLTTMTPANTPQGSFRDRSRLYRQAPSASRGSNPVTVLQQQNVVIAVQSVTTESQAQTLDERVETPSPTGSESVLQQQPIIQPGSADDSTTVVENVVPVPVVDGVLESFPMATSNTGEESPVMKAARITINGEPVSMPVSQNISYDYADGNVMEEVVFVRDEYAVVKEAPETPAPLEQGSGELDSILGKTGEPGARPAPAQSLVADTAMFLRKHPALRSPASDMFAPSTRKAFFDSPTAQSVGAAAHKSSFFESPTAQSEVAQPTHSRSTNPAQSVAASPASAASSRKFFSTSQMSTNKFASSPLPENDIETIQESVIPEESATRPSRLFIGPTVSQASSYLGTATSHTFHSINASDSALSPSDESEVDQNRGSFWDSSHVGSGLGNDTLSLGSPQNSNVPENYTLSPSSYRNGSITEADTRSSFQDGSITENDTMSPRSAQNGSVTEVYTTEGSTSEHDGYATQDYSRSFQGSSTTENDTLSPRSTIDRSMDNEDTAGEQSFTENEFSPRSMPSGSITDNGTMSSRFTGESSVTDGNETISAMSQSGDDTSRRSTQYGSTDCDTLPPYETLTDNETMGTAGSLASKSNHEDEDSISPIFVGDGKARSNSQMSPNSMPSQPSAGPGFRLASSASTTTTAMQSTTIAGTITETTTEFSPTAESTTNIGMSVSQGTSTKGSYAEQHSFTYDARIKPSGSPLDLMNDSKEVVTHAFSYQESRGLSETTSQPTVFDVPLCSTSASNAPRGILSHSTTENTAPNALHSLSESREGDTEWSKGQQEAHSKTQTSISPESSQLAQSLMPNTRSCADPNALVAKSGSQTEQDENPVMVRVGQQEDEQFILTAALKRKRTRVVQLLVVGLLGLLVAFLASLWIQSSCHLFSAHVEVGDESEVFNLHFGLWKYSPVDSAYKDFTYCRKYERGETDAVPIFSRWTTGSAMVIGGFSLVVLWSYLIAGHGTSTVWRFAVGSSAIAGVLQLCPLWIFASQGCREDGCSLGPAGIMTIVSSCVYFVVSFEMYFNCPFEEEIPDLVGDQYEGRPRSILSNLEMKDFKRGAKAYVQRVVEGRHSQYPSLNQVQRHNVNPIGESMLERQTKSGAYAAPSIV